MAAGLPRAAILLPHGCCHRVARRAGDCHRRQLHGPTARRVSLHRAGVDCWCVRRRHERARRDGRLSDAALPDPGRGDIVVLPGASQWDAGPDRPQSGASVQGQRRGDADDVLRPVVHPVIDRPGQHRVDGAHGADGDGGGRSGRYSGVLDGDHDRPWWQCRGALAVRARRHHRERRDGRHRAGRPIWRLAACGSCAVATKARWWYRRRMAGDPRLQASSGGSTG